MNKTGGKRSAAMRASRITARRGAAPAKVKAGLPSPALALQAYRRKRDFALTAEPEGSTADPAVQNERPKRKGSTTSKKSEPAQSTKPSGTQRLFVIQRHAARQLHYDVRLELNGVFKSWAVPRGPSLDPACKRLAVQVEDHPLAYGQFEGTIAHGQYGAGQVLLWDRGTWLPAPNKDPQQSLDGGHLHFSLHGEKLRGQWLLVRLARQQANNRTPQWLLCKLDDDWAQPGQGDAILTEQPHRVATEAPRALRRGRADTGIAAAMPAALRVAMPKMMLPQLATAVDRAPENAPGARWRYEVKYDGYRMLARIEGGVVALFSRTGKAWGSRVPGVLAALARLPVQQAWLDGELVVFDATGRSDFQALQNALDGDHARVTFTLFDLLWLDGTDWRERPQAQRKDALDALLSADVLVKAGGPLRRCEQLDAVNGQAAWQAACALGLEGLIAKNMDASYVSRRTSAWLKLKCRVQQPFVIGGYTPGQGGRAADGLGALLVGNMSPQGRLTYAGRVGTGFDRPTMASLVKRLKALHRTATPFDPAPSEALARDVQWVSPTLVAQLVFADWTQDGLLRHAVYGGLREDIDPRSVMRESMRPAAPEAILKLETGEAAKARVKIPTSMRRAKDFAVMVSHPERVVYEQPTLTKQAVVDYYASVAESMMAHAGFRPLALLRCPQGAAGTCFFQKHLSGRLPAGVALPTAADGAGGKLPYVLVVEPRGLVSLAQFGVIEIHAWGAKQPRIDRPDCITLDLDPADDLPWADVRDAALAARDLLQMVGLSAYLKTTGGKGLHVVAPLVPRANWAIVKAFAQDLAQLMVRAAPERFVATISKKQRAGKLFVDYLRNAQGATAVAAWSLRARPGAPVAMPVDWSALKGKLDIRYDRFNLKNAPGQRTKAHHAWAAFDADRRALSPSMQRAVKRI